MAVVQINIMKTKLLTLLLALTLLFFFVNYFDDDLQEGLDAIKRKDYKTAYNFFLPLAEQGDSNGQYFLGLMYYEGREVQQNDKEATKWFRLAAEQGDNMAQSNLGHLYADEKTGKKNYIKAHQWFNISGAKEITAMEKLMDPNQIAEAEKLARDWVKEHKKN